MNKKQKRQIALICILCMAFAFASCDDFSADLNLKVDFEEDTTVSDREDTTLASPDASVPTEDDKGTDAPTVDETTREDDSSSEETTSGEITTPGEETTPGEITTPEVGTSADDTTPDDTTPDDVETSDDTETTDDVETTEEETTTKKPSVDDGGWSGWY